MSWAGQVTLSDVGVVAEAVVDEGPTSWPIHEVGRNADFFPPESGRLLAARSALSLGAGHIHSNGRETKAPEYEI